MYQNHLFTLSLIKAVGEITEKKVNKITETGLNLLKFIPGQLAHFIDTTGDNLVVSEKQISYMPPPARIDEVIQNHSRAIEIFNLLMDIMLLDGPSGCKVNFERSYSSKNNTAKKSLELFKDESIFDLIGAKAVGFRIPYRDEYYQGELRVEPFFADHSKYFLGCNLLTVNLFQPEEMDKVFGGVIKLVTDRFEPFVFSVFL